MKHLVFIFFLVTSVISAQDKLSKVSLDGTTLQYSYSNGSTVDAYFANNNYHFHWISGPFKGIKGTVAYKVLKLNRKAFIINFYVEAHKSYVTLYFDFRKNSLVGSAFIDQPDNLIQSLDSATILKSNLLTN